MNESGLFNRLIVSSPNWVFVSMVFGVLSGATSAMLIPLLMTSLSPGSDGLEYADSAPLAFSSFEIENPRFAMMFAAVAALSIVLRTVSTIVLVRLSLDLATRLRSQLCEMIGGASVLAVEGVGPSNLLASLMTDVTNIVTAARAAPQVITNAMLLISLMLVIVYVNTDLFQCVILAIAVGSAITQATALLSRRYMRRSRESIDRLQEGIRGLIYGFKELKLDDRKRTRYFDEILLAANDDVLAAQKTGQTIDSVGSAHSQMLHYLSVGGIAFVLAGYYAISTPELIAVMMILFFASGPLGQLRAFVPVYVNARVSLARIADLMRTLVAERLVLPPREGNSDWSSVKFDHVSFDYENGGSRDGGFSLGPVDFELRKGEVTFIVGGNGSGKSTLGKLISLHYLATEGIVSFGNERVTAASLASFRRQISAIYSDYFLFDRLLLGKTDAQTEAAVGRYIKLLRLHEKVALVDGKFSTTTRLSDGQRRRLALLASWVEDKAIYLFDEWAADQDREFKAVFYEDILGQLKSRDKVVVVITHDERYFYVADQIIELEDGMIKSVTRSVGQVTRAV